MPKIKSILITCVCMLMPFAAFCDDNDLTNDVTADVTADVRISLDENILTAMQVVETVGTVEVRLSNFQQPVRKGISVMKGSALWTGLHSAVSCSIAGDSILTMNQLGKLTFLGGVQTKKGLEYNIAADSGFIIINARQLDKTAVIITLTTAVGTLECKNFAGQIYIGADHGILVTADKGTVKVKPKIKTFYTLRKGGMCAITKDGYLIDNDKLIRGKISAVPSNVTDAESVSMFINRFHDAYTKERYTNDYFDQRNR